MVCHEGKSYSLALLRHQEGGPWLVVLKQVYEALPSLNWAKHLVTFQKAVAQERSSGYRHASLEERGVLGAAGALSFKAPRVILASAAAALSVLRRWAGDGSGGGAAGRALVAALAGLEGGSLAPEPLEPMDELEVRKRAC